MRKITILLAALLLVSCASRQEKPKVSIIPEPSKVEVSGGYLDINDVACFVSDDVDVMSRDAIDSFLEAVSDTCAYTALRKNAVLSFVLNPKLEPEAYRIDISRRRATVEASSFNGFLYAIETMKQLLPAEIYTGETADWKLPCVRIEDSPRFAYRGMHLDVARHFYGVDQVKKYLDMMAVHKMNTFHWHLTDDQGWRVEIKKYPKLVEVGSMRKETAIGKGWYDVKYDGIPHGGYYTQEEIREIVRYAASLGITIIPEIDVPAHMLAAVAAYPELSCTGEQYDVWGRWGVSPNIMCAGKEEAFKFLEDVFLEIIDLFPGKYIHIGGDECPKTRWAECPACQARIRELGYENDENALTYLQGYVTNRVEAFLAEHGRSIIGWDEILDGKISQSATIMSWRGSDGGIAAAKAGHDAIMTPNSYCYFDYYQSRKIQDEPFAIGGFVSVEKVYSFEPYTPDMTPEQREHILGVQANLWTEYIKTPEHLEYMLLPRMSALSEVQWCTEENRDYHHFLDKMSHMLEIYHAMDFNYAKHIFEVMPVIGVESEKGCPRVELTTQGDAPMYYTLDGTTPTTSSAPYAGPVCVADGEVFKAIVDREEMETKVFTQTFSSHKAMGKPISMNTRPHPLYAVGLPESLVNGVLNESQDAAAGEWMAWHGEPVEVVIDMKGETCGKVSVRTFVSKWEDMYPPLGLAVYASDDNETFSELCAEEYPIEEETVPDGIKLFDVEFPEAPYKYLKVVVKTVPALPQWSERPGKPAYLFLDEIKVE